MVVLGSQASVDKVQKTFSGTVGIDGSLILGRNSAVDGTVEDGVAAIPFSLADGALVDISLKGENCFAHLPGSDQAPTQDCA